MPEQPDPIEDVETPETDAESPPGQEDSGTEDSESEVDPHASLTDDEREWLKMKDLSGGRTPEQILEHARYGISAKTREEEEMFKQKETETVAKPDADDADEDPVTMGQVNAMLAKGRKESEVELAHASAIKDLGLAKGTAVLMRGAVEKLGKTSGYTHLDVNQLYGIVSQQFKDDFADTSKTDAKLSRAKASAKGTSGVKGGGGAAPVASKGIPANDKYWGSKQHTRDIEKGKVPSCSG